MEADQTLIGGPRSGRPCRGAAGKTVVAGAVEAGRGKGRGRRLGRLLQTVPDAAADSLEGFLARNVARPAAVSTTAGKAMPGSTRPVMTTSRSISADPGHAALPLPGIHLIFGLAKRWLLGTHHGAVSTKHLQAYLDEYAFRFNRRTAKGISHRFARLVEQAVHTKPTTYRGIVATPAST